MNAEFQTPAVRRSLSVVTPPESPPNVHPKPSEVKNRKRQRTDQACEDESILLPVLSDFDSPVRFPRQRRRSMQIREETILHAMPTSKFPLPRIENDYDDDCQDDGPVVFRLAPRFQQYERVMDLSRVISSSSSNKHFKFAPTTKSFFLPLDL